MSDIIEQWEQEITEQDNIYFSREANLSNFDDSILNEDNVYIDGLGQCQISIFLDDEGDNEPHVHIKSKKRDIYVDGRNKQFDGCIKLHKAYFFPHSNHKDTFSMLKGHNTEHAAKSFNKFMSSKDKETGKQMWAVYRDRWLDKHNDVRNLESMDKPNYNTCTIGDPDDKKNNKKRKKRKR